MSGWRGFPTEPPPRWSFDFDDLQAVASVAGLKAWKINRDTYVLSRDTPAKPAFGPGLRSLLRRIKGLFARALSGTPQPNQVVTGGRGRKFWASPSP